MVFSAEEAKEWNERGEKVVLVRLETSPEDIEGMKAAQGILTVRGGMTSHAAVVARGMGKCCVSGCGEIKMDEEAKKFDLAGKTYHEGDWISIDGSTGKIYEGTIPTVEATISGYFGRIMGWAALRAAALNMGCSRLSSCFGSTRSTASSSVIMPSSTRSTATFRAAAAVRLPLRVWSM